MAVLIEDLNLVVRVSTLQEKYPGGLAQYRHDCPNDSFCCDGLITRIGSPARSDIDLFLDRLQNKGLVLSDEKGMRDIAVVAELRGMPDRCDWLEFARGADRPSVAFIVGSEPDKLVAVPKGWSLSDWQRGKEISVSGTPWSQMIYIRQDASDNVYLNRRTGQEVRVPRRIVESTGN